MSQTRSSSFMVTLLATITTGTLIVAWSTAARADVPVERGTVAPPQRQLAQAAATATATEGTEGEGGAASAPAVTTEDAPTRPIAQELPGDASPAAPLVSATRADPARSSAGPAALVSAQLPDWVRGLKVSGGAILWYYQPADIPGAKNNISLFFANLILDGHFGAFGLHIEPRFRDTRLRTYSDGPGWVWVQEVHASADIAPGTVLKVGKAYSHFGLFWDNSFYGNVQVYDGLKLDPDYGLSLEGAVRADAPAGLRYWAQFFLVDGQTNVSLAGRETFSIPGARRRNQAILRLEPFYKVTEKVGVRVGLSGAFLQADLPVVGKKNVFRGAVDATLSVGKWSLWGEYIRQNGQTVTEFPIAGTPATATSAAIAGRASAHNTYALVGTEVAALGPIAARYNVSTGRYSDLDVSEWMHVPGISVAAGDNLVVLGEFVYWKRYAPGGSTLLDRSANITLNGHF